MGLEILFCWLHCFLRRAFSTVNKKSTRKTTWIDEQTTMMILKVKLPYTLPQLQHLSNTKTLSNKHKHTVSLLHTPPNSVSDALKLVHEFDPKIPVEKAVTPPSSWYTHPSFFQLELHRVFYKGWQAVGSFISSTIFTFHFSHTHMTYTWLIRFYYLYLGCIEQIKNPQDFFTGRYR